MQDEDQRVFRNAIARQHQILAGHAQVPRGCWHQSINETLSNKNRRKSLETWVIECINNRRPDWVSETESKVGQFYRAQTWGHYVRFGAGTWLNQTTPSPITN